MWVAGVLAYVILSGLSPFGGRTGDDTMDRIHKCDVHFPKQAFEGIPDEAKDFIQKILLKNGHIVCRFMMHPIIHGYVKIM